MLKEKSCKSYMREVIHSHMDNRTGEVNYTSLAEDAANHFEAWNALDDDTHEIWDWAIEVGEEYEE